MARRVVAGLGNPGRAYEGTRHNVGFAVVDLLAQRGGATWGSVRDGASVAQVEGVTLLKPMLFINLSGPPVASHVRYYKVALEHVLVVVDDAALPLGTVRFSRAGSSSHNGLRSLCTALGTPAFARCRVGVGRPSGRQPLATHVLSHFEAHEEPALRQALAYAADGVGAWCTRGLDAAMNEYN